MLLVVVGNVDPAAVRALVEQVFASVPVGTYQEASLAAPHFEAPSLRLIARDLPTNYVVAAFPAPTFGSPELAAGIVAMSALHDKLFEEVRTKRQLSYAPSAGLLPHGLGEGYLYVSAVDAKRTLAAMRAALIDYQSAPLAADQLEGSKRVFLTSFLLQEEFDLRSGGAVGPGAARGRRLAPGARSAEAGGGGDAGAGAGVLGQVCAESTDDRAGAGAGVASGGAGGGGAVANPGWDLRPGRRSSDRICSGAGQGACEEIDEPSVVVPSEAEGPPPNGCASERTPRFDKADPWGAPPLRSGRHGIWERSRERRDFFTSSGPAPPSGADSGPRSTCLDCWPGLDVQQPPLHAHPTRPPAAQPVARHDPVTGDEDRKAAASHGATRGSGRAGVTGPRRELAVAERHTPGDRLQDPGQSRRGGRARPGGRASRRRSSWACPRARGRSGGRSGESPRRGDRRPPSAGWEAERRGSRPVHTRARSGRGRWQR